MGKSAIVSTCTHIVVLLLAYNVTIPVQACDVAPSLHDTTAFSSEMAFIEEGLKLVSRRPVHQLR